MTSTSPRILIIGGGIAGLSLATQLGQRLGKKNRAHIQLIDRSPTHIWKPMLHTIAAGTWDVHQQQVSFVSHAKEHYFTYVPGELTGLDRQKKEITLAPIYMPETHEELVPTRTVPYDVLVIAVGSKANDFGVPGVKDHCHFIDSQAQAEAFNAVLRARVVRSIFQKDELHISIVGAGATGVELAAELSQLLEIADTYGDENIRQRLHLTLLESGPRILASFPEQVSSSATAQLEKIGIKVRTNTKVIEAEPTGFRLGDGTLVPAELMVWAAGVKAAEVLGQLDGLDANRGNQLVVRPSLQTLQDDNIFVIGDAASLTMPGHDRPFAPTAQVANQQALHLIKHLPGWIFGKKPIPEFEYQDWGALVSISDYNAFGTLGKFGFLKDLFIRGRFAQLSHLYLYRRHQIELHGFLKAGLRWVAERINALVKPKIRMS